MDHQKKIRESKRLKNVAIISEVGLSYAIKETRETYIETAKQEKTYIMHEWSEKNRRKFFRMMVRHYLNWANKQAETGNMREITEDGSN